MRNGLWVREGTNVDALDASVIVCTYDRCESLSHTLQALARQQPDPEMRWELIVVDNNSRDDTRTVVERFAASSVIATVRYVFEASQGLSHARNRGIKEANGSVLLFTDDDARPEPDWIRRVLEGMDQHNCDGCGGYIAPEWEVPPPPWLTERFYRYLALRIDRLDTYQVAGTSEVPFGANMAFRREVFQRIGPFDVTRGRKGNFLAGGEEIDLFERLLAKGGKVMFFGDVRVYHRIEKSRLTKRYFRRLRYQSSRNIAQSEDIAGDRRFLGVPLYMFPQFARACRNAIMARLSQPRDEAFHRELIVWHFLGLITGLAASRHCPGKSSNRRPAGTSNRR